MATKKPVMPHDTCGACRFSYDVRGQTFLLCMANPPYPVKSEVEEDEIEWLRGAAVESQDPACFFFQPKARA